jgi:hypothetical protein
MDYIKGLVIAAAVVLLTGYIRKALLRALKKTGGRRYS